MSDEQQMTEIAADPIERPLSAIELARAKVAELERKLGAFDDRARVNRETRAACGPNDKKTLTQLHDEAGKLSLQKEDTIAWLGRARAELAAAEAAEAAEAAQAESVRIVALFDRLVAVYDHIDKACAALVDGMHAADEVERLIAQSGCGYPPSGAPNLQQRLRLATVLHVEFPAGWARSFESRPPSREDGRPRVEALGPIAAGWRENVCKRLGVAAAAEAAE
jgi:hypothetical protein